VSERPNLLKADHLEVPLTGRILSFLYSGREVKGLFFHYYGKVKGVFQYFLRRNGILDTTSRSHRQLIIFLNRVDGGQPFGVTGFASLMQHSMNREAKLYTAAPMMLSITSDLASA